MSDPVSNATGPIRFHTAVYGRLLLLYPAEFRRAYGGLMAQLFRDQCQAAHKGAGRRAMASLWAQTLLDTGKAAGREHLSNLRKWFRLPGKNSPRNTLMNAPIPSRYRAAKWLIPAGILVGLLVAASISLTMPKEYRSDALLLVTPKLPVGDANTAQMLKSPDSVETTVAMMQSDAVIQRVLGKFKEGLGGTNQLVRPSLSVLPRGGGIFQLTVSSANFEYSRQFATIWAQEFVDYAQQRHRSQVSDAEARIAQNILIFQKKLDAVQQARGDFQKKYNGTATGGAESLVQRRLEETKAEYATLRMELREAENVTAEQLAQTAPGNRWFDFRLEQKRSELRLQAAPNDSSLKAEFALRQDDLKALLAVTEEMRTAKIESLKRRIAGYPQRIEELTGSFFDSALLRVELQRLEDEEKFVHEQLDDLNRSSFSLKRISNDEGQFSILSVGGGAPRPVGPNRQMILLAGFTLGALAGLALALIRARSGGPKDPGTPSSTAPLIPAPIGA
jgi:uncharacterized protein involved in exopolysaccharide biosynthesis